uniref:Putative secreted peptide n=1 Tax=Anopheles braziliensis TaxID=58242 RepID=A0A2M3ZWE3_9DIPT
MVVKRMPHHSLSLSLTSLPWCSSHFYRIAASGTWPQPAPNWFFFDKIFEIKYNKCETFLPFATISNGNRCCCANFHFYYNPPSVSLSRGRFFG